MAFSAVVNLLLDTSDRGYRTSGVLGFEPFPEGRRNVGRVVRPRSVDEDIRVQKEHSDHSQMVRIAVENGGSLEGQKPQGLGHGSRVSERIGDELPAQSPTNAERLVRIEAATTGALRPCVEMKESVNLISVNVREMFTWHVSSLTQSDQDDECGAPVADAEAIELGGEVGVGVEVSPQII